MDGHSILRWIEQGLGVVLIAVVLLDVFLTVLYARVGTGIISHPLACLTWRAFRALSKPFTQSRDTILSVCGPAIIVLVIGVWYFTLMLGAALVVHPKLGTGITA